MEATPLPDDDRTSGLTVSELETERMAVHRIDSQYPGERGKTVIAEGIVEKIATLAVREVRGVHELAEHGVGRTVFGLFGAAVRVRQAPVTVKVVNDEVTVQVGITVNYGVHIPQVVEAVRRNVVEHIESMTGLAVKEVNVDVIDMYFPDDLAWPGQREQAFGRSRFE
jgi:uncharacterized alkaline shock family protein YloU